MLYNKIGKSVLTISQVGLGGMSLMQDQFSVNQYIIDQASEIGINYLDTADLYDKGENEELIGKLLHGNRNNWIVASKVGNKWNDSGTGWTWDPRKSTIMSSVERSLTRLKTDYLDLYQLHGGTIEDQFDEIVEAFETLVAQGKIRYYGISSIRPNVFLKYISQSNIISNMMQFSLLDQRPMKYFGEFEKENVNIIARGALTQGLLLGKQAMNYLGYTQDQVLQAQRKFEDLSKKLKVSELALALKFPLLHQVVCSCVIGIRTKDQIDDLAESIQCLGNISIHDYQDFLDILPALAYTQHIE